MEESYKILRTIEHESALTQRGLAERLGCSLGKVNYLVSALIDKGFVKLENFSQSKNKLAYRYVVTPAGIAEKVRLTREFLARKECEYVALKAEIAELKMLAEKEDVVKSRG